MLHLAKLCSEIRLQFLTASSSQEVQPCQCSHRLVDDKHSRKVRFLFQSANDASGRDLPVLGPEEQGVQITEPQVVLQPWEQSGLRTCRTKGLYVQNICENLSEYIQVINVY